MKVPTSIVFVVATSVVLVVPTSTIFPFFNCTIEFSTCSSNFNSTYSSNFNRIDSSNFSSICSTNFKRNGSRNLSLLLGTFFIYFYIALFAPQISYFLFFYQLKGSVLNDNLLIRPQRVQEFANSCVPAETSPLVSFFSLMMIIAI